MSMQWVDHKGKAILLADMSGLDEASYVNALDEAQQELLRQPAGSRNLLLVDVSGSTMTLKTRDKGKELIQALEEKNITAVTAMVGVTSLTKFIAQVLGGGDVYFAKGIEDGKDWLARQKDG